MAVVVRDHRTGYTSRDESWKQWRARWDRRRRSFRSRVTTCPWCWCFGALEATSLGAIGVPCLNCGRIGVTR